MSKKEKKLVLVGAGEFGGIAYEYFTADSEYEVVAFAVEREYRTCSRMRGIPVIDFEDLNKAYPPEEYEVFVAVTYVRLNRERTRLYLKCREAGYRCASYISSKASVWPNTRIGDHVFIFEQANVQYYAEIGNNVILWNAGQIGHRSTVKDNAWIAPGVVVAGFSEIGRSCFVGVNASVGDHVRIQDDIVIGAGTVAVRDLDKAGGIYVGVPAKLLQETAYARFGAGEEAIPDRRAGEGTGI